MLKRSFLWAILFAFMLLASGCVTVYTDGCCPGSASKQGAKQAGKGEKFTNVVKGADDWVKNNIW
jgi:hypothetical protein